MTIPRITCYFMGADIDLAPSLERYKHYFLEYSPEKWRDCPGDASFAYETSDRLLSELYVLSDANGGLSLRFSYRSDRQSFYSVGSREHMSSIIDAGDDQYAPEGSFVDPALAWLAVEDFFRAPLEPSRRLSWLDASEIDWPD
ncbi:hypothetical protein [Stenotrophomonas sp.]|uniref:hypothetical protein n=1 Tax=Stenotrophomonas sp. TaxID=69392 RepID=UPI0028986F1C|nr:hypothetical protein [Stenotrophomonas sp.]